MKKQMMSLAVGVLAGRVVTPPTPMQMPILPSPFCIADICGRRERADER
jgi:hypothetical protein